MVAVEKLVFLVVLVGSDVGCRTYHDSGCSRDSRLLSSVVAGSRAGLELCTQHPQRLMGKVAAAHGMVLNSGAACHPFHCT